MYFANCHNHSTFSDGVYTPEKLVELAVEVGHKAIILTDHDTVRGTYFLQKAARKAGLLSLLGCEFSTMGFGTDFHLVGIDFNPENKVMKSLLERASQKQTSRSKMLYEWGLENGTIRPGVSWQEILDYFPYHDYFCNNQIFTVLTAKNIYRHEEYPEFFVQNFRHVVGSEKEARIEEITGYYTPDVEEVVKTIIEAGGVPVIAHPHKKEAYVKDLIKMGVMGFETIHPDLTKEEQAYYDELCSEYRLYKLGGTDHSSVLGGYADCMPKHDLGPESGYVTEGNFMQLYRRELG